MGQVTHNLWCLSGLLVEQRRLNPDNFRPICCIKCQFLRVLANHIPEGRLQFTKQPRGQSDKVRRFSGLRARSIDAILEK